MQAVAHTFSSLSLKPMELRNRATGAVITDSQFRAENRNTSFPPQLTAEIIDSFGYDPVLGRSTSHHHPAVSVQPTRRRG
jgi:hypothetical protein